MSLEIKKTPLVIVPYGVVMVAFCVLLGFGKITFVQFLAGLAALNMPAVLGLKGEEDSPVPPAGPYRSPGALELIPDDVPTSRDLKKPPSLPMINTPITELAIFTAAFALVAAAMGGCLAGKTPSEKADIADHTYLGEMEACVAQARTLEDSHTCRAEVRKRWNVDGGDR